MSPAEFAERTAQAQGLPARVEDPTALARIAVLLTAPPPEVPDAAA